MFKFLTGENPTLLPDTSLPSELFPCSEDTDGSGSVIGPVQSDYCFEEPQGCPLTFPDFSSNSDSTDIIPPTPPLSTVSSNVSRCAGCHSSPGLIWAPTMASFDRTDDELDDMVDAGVPEDRDNQGDHSDSDNSIIMF